MENPKTETKENEINPKWKLHMLIDLEARIFANKNRYILGLRTLSNVAFENEHIIRALNSLLPNNVIANLLNQIVYDIDMINVNANEHGYANFYIAMEKIENNIMELKEKLGTESVYLPIFTMSLAKTLESYCNEMTSIVYMVEDLTEDIKDVLYSVEKDYSKNEKLLDYDGISYVEKAKKELKQLHRIWKALSHICWLSNYLEGIANSLEP